MQCENLLESYRIFEPLSGYVCIGLVVCQLIMSLAERFSLKFPIYPQSLTSLTNIFFSCGYNFHPILYIVSPAL